MHTRFWNSLCSQSEKLVRGPKSLSYHPIQGSISCSREDEGASFNWWHSPHNKLHEWCMPSWQSWVASGSPRCWMLSRHCCFPDTPDSLARQPLSRNPCKHGSTLARPIFYMLSTADGQTLGAQLVTSKPTSPCQMERAPVFEVGCRQGGGRKVEEGDPMCCGVRLNRRPLYGRAQRRDAPAAGTD